jgi:Ca-activated chloride channel family protein
MKVTTEKEEIVVEGIRESLVKSMAVKRDASSVVDAISSEDIGKFSDQNLAEALQRTEQVQLAEHKIRAKKEDAAAGAAMATKAKSAMEAMPMSVSPAPIADMAISMPYSPPVEVPNSQPKEYRDRFSDFEESPVIATRENAVSTFSIDVDTAAYSFTRRMLNQGQLPPKDAVRVEEMINYFDYDYPLPKNKAKPFTTTVTVMDSPWKVGNKLVHIGIQGYQLPANEIPQSNLVFLLDVSGSMNEQGKLPLLKSSMELLLTSLKPNDTVAIVVYAGAAGTVLEPTKVKDKAKIIAALNNLQAGGSTAGAEGIALAYQLAEANFNPKGVNRIILGTDGDFNVGQTGDEALQDFVERKREKGIYLSVLGFGQGNYQDAMMQTLAQNGNGTAAYIDTLSEAQKVLVTEATSSLFPIAKDVKIQV